MPVVRYPVSRLAVPQQPAAAPLRINHRPNDGSGLWADYSNTGYLNYAGSASSGYSACTHGYSGLYDFESGMSATGAVSVDSSGPLDISFSKLHFRGKSYLGNNARCDSMTFSGCVFDGTWPNDNLIQVYLPVLFKLSYCTLRPAEWRAPVTTPQGPPGNSGSYATAHTAPGTPYTDSWQLIAAYQNSPTTGQTGNFRTEMDHCDIWGNAGMEVTGGGSSATPTYFSWCYIHDQSDTDLSGGSGYHQDGIGPDSTGPETWINVTNCTIASLANTNAIAFQGSGGCNNCSITGNYFSGWGLGISLSVAGPTADYSVTFTDNVWSAEVPFGYGPSYAHWNWSSGGTPPAVNSAMTWRRNLWQYLAGDPTDTWTWSGGPAQSAIGWDTSWQGTYWWPSDDSSHASDYTG